MAIRLMSTVSLGELELPTKISRVFSKTITSILTYIYYAFKIMGKCGVCGCGKIKSGKI